VFFNVGMGLSFYKAKMTDKTTGEVVNGMDLTDGQAMVFPIALLVEYNISKYFAVGLKGEYRLHDKDNYEGYVGNVRQGNWNDAFEVLTATFRYKPHFGKAYHVRNLSYGDPSMRDVNRRLAELENMIKNMKTDTCCNKVEKLAKQVDQKVDSAFVENRLKGTRVVNNTPQNNVDERTKKTFNEALRGVQFETAKADIKPVSFPILDRIVTIMKENPKFDLDIIGHTDNAGNPQSNLDLSDRRAHAVRTYLMNKGIESYRLTSLGKGQENPIATNSTPEGKALNRRVEFIVKQDGVVLLNSDHQ
jgi:outer membrane protein OmpA-like peptidoglycan-associated protein